MTGKNYEIKAFNQSQLTEGMMILGAKKINDEPRYVVLEIYPENEDDGGSKPKKEGKGKNNLPKVHTNKGILKYQASNAVARAWMKYKLANSFQESHGKFNFWISEGGKPVVKNTIKEAVQYAEQLRNLDFREEIKDEALINKLEWSATDKDYATFF